MYDFIVVVIVTIFINVFIITALTIIYIIIDISTAIALSILPLLLNASLVPINHCYRYHLYSIFHILIIPRTINSHKHIHILMCFFWYFPSVYK